MSPLLVVRDMSHFLPYFACGYSVFRLLSRTMLSTRILIKPELRLLRVRVNIKHTISVLAIPVSLSPSTIELPPSALSAPMPNAPFSRHSGNW
uniref:Uncharacterized protein n=1 Tax=Salmonella sp. TaxID=599 RepID=A0A482ETS0_SALSP|nr:hypothetical protein NNIBIDOC_00214 [Salmonella sp.]